MKLINDLKNLLTKDEFQEDFIFLLYFTLLRWVDLIPNETFEMIAIVIIGGDAMKRMGKWKG
jgi:hypothetical protein